MATITPAGLHRVLERARRQAIAAALARTYTRQGRAVPPKLTGRHRLTTRSRLSVRADWYACWGWYFDCRTYGGRRP